MCIQHGFPMATDSSNHCENIVSAIRHINKEKFYLDSIKEIISYYDNSVLQPKNPKIQALSYIIFILDSIKYTINDINK